MSVTYNFKEGTAEDAAERNTLLGVAEPGFERDTIKLKIGDGKTRYNDLPYFLNENGVAALISTAIAGLGSKTMAFIRDDGSGYSARSTVTTDPSRVVVWIGTDAPPIGAPYARDNVDVWWKLT